MKKIFTLYIVIQTITLLTSCVMTRAIMYGNASVDDYRIFANDTIRKGEIQYTFAEKNDKFIYFDTLKLKHKIWKEGKYEKMTIAEGSESDGKPSAVLIIRNDTILYEHYFNGWDRNTQSTIFSITKSITSMLCGIALKEGYIKSVNDKVTDYIPELAEKDTMFSKLTIENLLDMTAGLDFREDYSWNPFTKMARLYMGNNAMKSIEGMTFLNEPGERYDYNSMTTAILGIVIERATGTSYADYLSEKVWKPLGMEKDAYISMDDKKHKVAKSYAGMVSNVRDLAKIGRLYLNHGNWNGIQLIDSSFVQRSLSQHFAGKKGIYMYSYSWYWGEYDEYIGTRDFQNKKEMQNYYKTHPELTLIDYSRNKQCITASEYTDRLYFKSKKELLTYYKNKGKKVYITLQNKYGYFALFDNGNHSARGILGQTLLINPEKNCICVVLGADVSRYLDLFNQITRLI